VKRALLALAIACSLVAVTTAADAEHEVYYRYTVLGYVKDAKGRPIRGREVMLVRDKTGFSYLGETDAKGLYIVVMRLGDESAGERLTLRSGGAATGIVVQFDVANRREERGTRIDVEGTRFVERSAWFPSTLALYLGAAGR